MLYFLNVIIFIWGNSHFPLIFHIKSMVNSVVVHSAVSQLIKAKDEPAMEISMLVPTLPANLLKGMKI